MRIDLPGCNFKNCRFSYDGNCTNKIEYDRCEYRLAKDGLAEAEPVRHGCDMCEIMESGHWIRLYNGNGWEVGIGRRIDGYELVINHSGEHFATKIDYCPYCGAKLDGGEKKNE